MSLRPGRLNRRQPFRAPRRRILVVCEGKKTEPLYFRALIREEALKLVEVVIDDKSGVPKTLVERSIHLKKDAARDAKREGDDFLRYDAVWCVFDVDSHPNLPEAKQQARDNGVNLAISNPCFELWLLLHFQDHTAFIDRKKLQRACSERMPGYKKEAPYEVLRGTYEEAVARAESLERRHNRDGSPGENPSTDVFKLTTVLMSEGRESQLRIARTRSEAHVGGQPLAVSKPGKKPATAASRRRDKAGRRGRRLGFRPLSF